MFNVQSNRRSRWRILTALSIALISMASATFAPAEAQYNYYSQPGVRYLWNPPHRQRTNSHHQRSQTQFRMIVPADICGWNATQNVLSKDSEQFANQLAMYLVLPGRPATGGQDVRLVNELNSLRQEISFLIGCSNSAQPYGFWESQLHQLRQRTTQMDPLVIAVAPYPAAYQRWIKVKSGVNSLISLLYWNAGMRY